MTHWKFKGKKIPLDITGPCTFTVTNTEWRAVRQPMQRCDTCALEDVCASCVAQCHADHSLSSLRKAADRFCDCGGSTRCRAGQRRCYCGDRQLDSGSSWALLCALRPLPAPLRRAVWERVASSVHLRVTLKTLTGKSVCVEVDAQGSVLDLKRAVQEQEGVPVDQQRLIVAGQQMQDSGALQEDYGVTQETTVHMLMTLRD